MREDQFITHLVVDGRDCGDWDSFDGGDTDSEDEKYKPAGMPRKSLGGASEVGNITLGRLYERPRDTDLFPWLRKRCGRGNFVATRHTLDADDNRIGIPEVFTGKLKRATPPSSDSQSSGAALGEVELAPDAAVA